MRAGLWRTLAGVGLAAAASSKLAVRRAAAPRRRLTEDDMAVWFEPLDSDRTGTIAMPDGVQIYFEEVGPEDAPLTVVFAHGINNNRDAWRFQRSGLRDALGERVRMVFFDHRSHGRSDLGEAANTNLEQLGDDLAGLITERVPHGPIVLVGHSLGGMTIMTLAERHPDLFDAHTGRVVAVALIATSSGQLSSLTFGLPAPVAGAVRGVVGLSARRARQAAREAARKPPRSKRPGDLDWLISRRTAFHGSPDPALVEYITRVGSQTPQDVNANFHASLVTHDRVGALATIAHLPVLLVGGAGDLLLPEEHTMAIAAALPDAELLMVPDAGHMVMMERPEVVNEALEKLITGVLDA